MEVVCEKPITLVMHINPREMDCLSNHVNHG